MNPFENYEVIKIFSGCLREGGIALKNAPGLLTKIINEDMWRKRIVHELHDKEVCFDRFEDFVTALPWEGLGEDLESIKRICRDDAVALEAIDRVTQRGRGQPEKKEGESIVDNINNTRPDGTSRQQAIRSLRSHRPDLLEKVLSKELTAHKAMLEAGLRKPTITVELNPKGVLKALQKLKPEQLQDEALQSYLRQIVKGGQR